MSMARKRSDPGNVIAKTLDDGWTYYGRLLEFPWAVFHRYRTRQPVDDLAAVTASPVLFIVAAHKDLLARGQWDVIGHLPLDGSVQPQPQAIWDIVDPTRCRIIDTDGETRAATPEECEDLEPAAVWEPEHI